MPLLATLLVSCQALTKNNHNAGAGCKSPMPLPFIGTITLSHLPVPFDGSSTQYVNWRQARLARADKQAKLPVMAIDLGDPTLQQQKATLGSLIEHMNQHGFVHYHWPSAPAPEQAMHRLGIQQLCQALALQQPDTGVLREADGLSLLQDKTGSQQGRYISYTNRAMNWHTDGYYNSIATPVRCFLLHCMAAAADGGALTLLDPELLLIALYDHAPHLIQPLCHPAAICLPANTDTQGHDRPARHSAVFFCHPDGSLGLRYTQRTRNIQFKDANTHTAVLATADVIETHCRAWQQQLRLQPGQGLLTRNILHKRSAFQDQPGHAARQVLRGRFSSLPDATGLYSHLL